ncbi:MAG TPA: hypothetical protein VI685_05380 [Candidatus Angelobacter sp.]
MSDSQIHLHQPEHNPGGEGPSFHYFFISLKTMEPRLRVLTGVVLAQIVTAVLMLAFRDVNVHRLGLRGLDLEIPWINYAFAYACVGIALCLVCFGALQADWKGRLLFFVALGGLYIVGIAAFFREDPTGKISIVFTLFFWAYMAGALPVAYRRRYSPERQKMWMVRLFLVLGTLPIALVVLFSPAAFAEALILLRIPLPYLFLLAGTDWAEISDSIVRSAVNGTRMENKIRALFVAASLASAYLTFFMAYKTGWQGFLFLPAAIVAVGIVFLILRWTSVGDWPIHFPWAAMALAVVIFAMLMDVTVKNNWSPYIVVPLCVFLVTSIMLVGFHKRTWFAPLRPVALFLLVLAATWALFLVPVPDRNWDSPLGLFLCIGAISLLALSWIRWKQWPARNLAEPLRLILLLNVGTLGLYWLYAVLYAGARKAAEDTVMIDACVILVALVWDILVSGHSITNVDGKWFPRRSRVYLFFGYVMLIVATVLFWGSVHGKEESLQVAHIYADPEGLVQMGIALYGPAMLLTLFILRMGKWSSGTHAGTLLRDDGPGELAVGAMK